jgi:hypothetical protein
MLTETTVSKLREMRLSVMANALKDNIYINVVLCQ